MRNEFDKSIQILRFGQYLAVSPNPDDEARRFRDFEDNFLELCSKRPNATLTQPLRELWQSCQK
jgi:hypothetical protein